MKKLFKNKNNIIKYFFVIALFVLSVCLITSCDINDYLSESDDETVGFQEEIVTGEIETEITTIPANETENKESEEKAKETIEESSEISETESETKEKATAGNEKTTAGNENNNDKKDSEDKLYDLKYKDIPKYDGEVSVTLNNNKPFLTKIYKGEFEEYSELDELGRCGVAFANVGLVTMPTEPRGEIGMIKPSGWHTVKYPELIEDRYLYNRCHLIGYQLAGENANEKNLITGTRYFNVEGMLPYENQVASYINRTGNHVNYRVTPIFKGDDLVCRGVVMEAQSVEDEATGVCFCVFVYNVQPYIKIDYATGDSKPNKEGRKIIKESKNQSTDSSLNNNNSNNSNNNSSNVNTNDNSSANAKSGDENTCDYILNANTRKFHYPTCRSVGQMAEHNKIYFSGTRDEVIDMGYDPCGNCHP